MFLKLEIIICYPHKSSIHSVDVEYLLCGTYYARSCGELVLDKHSEFNHKEKR